MTQRAFDEASLLGFDARSDACIEQWDAARRRLYLLRPVALPRSADASVWTTPLSDRVGLNFSLWPDLALVERALAELEPDPTVQLLAVTAEGDSATRMRYPGVIPAEGNWTLLGHDVCDDSLLSGLMNCGYTELDREAVAAFVDRLNPHHLFDDATDAGAFAGVRNAQVPEHAPFVVVGLWTRTR